MALLTAVFTSRSLNRRPWRSLTLCRFHLNAYEMGGEVLKIATVILKKDHFVSFIRQEQTLVLCGAFTLPKVGAPTHSTVTSGGLPRGVQVQGHPLGEGPPWRGPEGRSFQQILQRGFSSPLINSTFSLKLKNRIQGMLFPWTGFFLNLKIPRLQGELGIRQN